MSNTVIKVEEVGKLYKLGEIGTGTISHDLNRWWARIRGKEDPFAKIGDTNDRTAKGASDWVWALKDINFEVKQGEILGIIGRNGAGKSTLLKILSKVTTPSTGRIKVKGRIASLLEVGTGFHPELTGRENIYLNGAILGMTKAEIRSKFDAIVDFAGVERYIDTPVKRYSSGMYVRLAFAVAAHLDPEILIVDEVLAVGDAEFQKKCLGKMKDVSVNDGRTVLFVSHNIAAVKQLCNQSILLENGSLIKKSYTDEIVNLYMHSEQNKNYSKDKVLLNNHIIIEKIEFISNPGSSCEDVDFILQIKANRPTKIDSIGLIFNNIYENRIAILDLRSDKGAYKLKDEFDVLSFKGKITRIPLIEGDYKIGLFLSAENTVGNFFDLLDFYVSNKSIPHGFVPYPKESRGLVEFVYDFQINK